jgi:hypothetical protein
MPKNFYQSCFYNFSGRLNIILGMCMKVLNIFLLVLLPLSTVNLSAKNNMTEMEQVVATFNELSNYFAASVQFHLALREFQRQHDVKASEITCKYCPKRIMPCDELIVKVQAKAMDAAIGAETCAADEVRKKMLTIYEGITQLLHLGSIDDVKKIMVKIAQDEAIPCEDCQRCEWESGREINIRKGEVRIFRENDLSQMQKNNDVK